MEHVIHAEGVVKTFGSTRALDGLDLTVEPGQVHGFLGPNGAGKSTTIRVLLGLLRKDAGQVRVLGGHPWRDAVALHRRLAYVPGDVNLRPNLSGGEAIDLLTDLRAGRGGAVEVELLLGRAAIGQGGGEAARAQGLWAQAIEEADEGEGHQGAFTWWSARYV